MKRVISPQASQKKLGRNVLWFGCDLKVPVGSLQLNSWWPEGGQSLGMWGSLGHYSTPSKDIVGVLGSSSEKLALKAWACPLPGSLCSMTITCTCASAMRLSPDLHQCKFPGASQKCELKTVLPLLATSGIFFLRPHREVTLAINTSKTFIRREPNDFKWDLSMAMIQASKNKSNTISIFFIFSSILGINTISSFQIEGKIVYTKQTQY